MIGLLHVYLACLVLTVLSVLAYSAGYWTSLYSIEEKNIHRGRLLMKVAWLPSALAALIFLGIRIFTELM